MISRQSGRRALASLMALGALAATLLSASSSRADEKAACVAASDQGQTLETAHKLLEARDQFVLCAQPTCPALVQQACAGWLGDLQKLLPTVVMTAKDGAGADVVDVVVTVDGHPLATKLDGEGVPVDPGPHVFHFALADGSSVDKSFVVLEGQKAQRLSVDGFGKQHASPSASGGGAASGADGVGSGRRVAAVVVGAVGLAGVALGGVFGGLTLSSWNSASSECPTHNNCSTGAVGDRSAAVTFRTASDVGFIAGGVLVAAGLTLYFTAPKEQGATVGTRLTPGGLQLVGSF